MPTADALSGCFCRTHNIKKKSPENPFPSLWTLQTSLRYQPARRNRKQLSDTKNDSCQGQPAVSCSGAGKATVSCLLQNQLTEQTEQHCRMQHSGNQQKSPEWNPENLLRQHMNQLREPCAESGLEDFRSSIVTILLNLQAVGSRCSPIRRSICFRSSCCSSWRIE
jgi:hypothetical protein